MMPAPMLNSEQARRMANWRAVGHDPRNSQPWYNSLEESTEWDERSGTLTFNTFRPPPPSPFPSRQLGTLEQSPAYPRRLGPSTFDPNGSGEEGWWAPPSPATPRQPGYYEHIAQNVAPYRYRELELGIRLLEGESKVGFSMCGGAGEGLPSLINQIIRGSPADRAGLGIGDEIVEINGVSVEMATHTEIVHHIHQCIRSRTIQLRVRRKQDDVAQKEQARFLGSGVSAKEAYLISVDGHEGQSLAGRLRLRHPGLKAYDMETLHAHLNKGGPPGPLPEIPDAAPPPPPPPPPPSSAPPPLHADQMERLRSYEQELRKRNEKTNESKKEQEFLRTSLRGSKKLVALSEPSGGQPNPAFSADPTTPSDPAAADLRDVLASAETVAAALDSASADDSRLIRGLFAQPAVHSAISVSRSVGGARALPESADALATANAVDELSADATDSPAAARLHEELGQPHLRSLLHTHDVVASSSEGTSSPGGGSLGLRETPMAAEEGGGELSIVKILKHEDTYLGATVKADGDSIVIGRIIKGGAAEKSSLLKPGDELWEVNGTELRGKSVNEVCDLLRSMSGQLTFIIRPANALPDKQEEVAEIRHMRAMFDYDPEDDFYVPCRELALKFQKRDVLHIISTADEQWWQGFRDGEDPAQAMLAGLVPSAGFQLQRELYQREVAGENAKNSARHQSPSRREAKSASPSLICGKKPKRKLSSSNGTGAKVTHLGSNGATPVLSNGDLSTDELPASEVRTYEEVALYLGGSGRARPVVLVGPPNVGCLELRQKLMEAEADKFAGIVPHTSRARKAAEVDGVHYHFVTRQIFSEEAAAGAFVEWGEWERALFGTSRASIERVLAKGLTPLLTLKPRSLKALRATGLRPFVVFVSPRSLERLRVNRQRNPNTANLKDEELRAILREAEEMESDYGHLFDKVLLFSDLQSAYTEIRNMIHLLETEPQWVPVEWLESKSS